MVTSGLCHSGTPVHQLTGVFIQWGLISVIAKLIVNGEPQGCDLNSFVLLTFDKTAILEVSRMGTINLALRPDVHCTILQLLEVLSRLKACFFYAMDA